MVWLSLFASAVLTQSPAAPPACVAALEWTTVDVQRELASFYSEHLAKALRERGLKVVTSREIATLLGLERQKELLGCADGSASCLAEVGNALGCDGILMVSLARLDDVFRTHLKVVSSQNAKVLAETAAEAQGERALLGALDAAAERLATRLGAHPAAAPPSALVSAPSGEEQGRSKAWIPLTAAAAGAGAGTVLVLLSSAQHDRLVNHLQASGPDAEARAIAARGASMQTWAWVSFGAGAAALALAGALRFAGPEPLATPTAWLSNDGSGIALTGAWP